MLMIDSLLYRTRYFLDFLNILPLSVNWRTRYGLRRLLSRRKLSARPPPLLSPIPILWNDWYICLGRHDTTVVPCRSLPCKLGEEDRERKQRSGAAASDLFDLFFIALKISNMSWI